MSAMWVPHCSQSTGQWIGRVVAQALADVSAEHDEHDAEHVNEAAHPLDFVALRSRLPTTAVRPVQPLLTPVQDRAQPADVA